MQRLVQWELDKRYMRPNQHRQAHIVRPTIGQMIEFLYMNETVIIESEDYEGPLQGWIVNKTYARVLLVDALWEAVKDVLKKQS